MLDDCRIESRANGNRVPRGSPIHAGSGVLTVGSLFSGIGGIDLGLEQAGMRVAWQCESDEFCRRVLARHWPGVPCFEDVRTVTAPERVSILAGGFPCQDISQVGRRAGIAGERSGLWTEFARLVRDLRPKYVLVENVPGLLARGMGVVLGDLAACGYDAEWDCLPAAAFGAPHLRARIFVLAYPCGRRGSADDLQAGWHPARRGRAAVAVADTNGRRREGLSLEDGAELASGRLADGRRAGDLAYAHSEPLVRNPIARSERDPWSSEPDVGRVADGVPARVDRLRSLGNAVVPQIAEWLGRRILEYERQAA